MTSPLVPSSPLIVGHRGAATLEPENTELSFRRGVADDADIIETDVHLTKDGVVVAHHDPAIDRTAVSGRTTGAIADLTYAELQEDALAEGQHILTLPEVLDVVTGALFVEIKAEAASEETVRIIREKGAIERVTIISFLPDALRRVRAAEPALPIALIAGEFGPEQHAVLDELHAEGASVHVSALASVDVEAQHAAGRTVNAWTLHTFDEVRRALAAGADTITADDPAWARVLRDRLLAEG